MNLIIGVGKAKNLLYVLNNGILRELLAPEVCLYVLLKVSKAPKLTSMTKILLIASTKAVSPSVPTAWIAESFGRRPIIEDKKIVVRSELLSVMNK